MVNSWFIRQLLPPLAKDGFRYARSLLSYLCHWRVLQRNNAVKNSRSGGAVYVLGNGPSLNNFDLTSIYSQDVITMNFFHLHPNLNEFNVVAHCIGEPFDCATWVDPDDMVEKTNAGSYWFNLTAEKFCRDKYPGKKLFYYLPGVGANFDVLRGADLSRPTLQYQSTAQMAIMVAMQLGYAKIYLLGFDHDWLVTRGYSPHFYNEEGDDEATVPKADFSQIPYLSMINISKNLFEGYEALKKIAKRSGVAIVNLSTPTYLDVFPYKD